jgi:hypothetical protein
MAEQRKAAAAEADSIRLNTAGRGIALSEWKELININSTDKVVKEHNCFVIPSPWHTSCYTQYLLPMICRKIKRSCC